MEHGCNKERELDRIEEKLDKIVEDIGDIKAIEKVNSNSLAEHIRRTALLEQEVKLLSAFQYKILGVALFVAFIVPIILTIINILK